MNRVEVLAPAGNYDSFIYAINNGANAIYLAGKSFGARANASNFTNEELVSMIDYAHQVDVKVYVTVNTIIKDEEFDDAVSFVRFLYINNVDAVIVQDLGLMDEIIHRFPELDVHASTQVNVHSLAQAQFLKELGVKRIIMARETSINVIKEICDKVDIEVEVFVHGALCMSYSGNCYFSSMMGDRSGNRGRCAQPCRLIYDLEDGEEQKYFLSPKDLMTIDYVNEYRNAGVTSFKIEGRMRRAEYVGLAVRAYVDALNGSNNDYEKELKLMYNRDFTKGYAFGEANTNFTNINSSNHIGIEIGNVTGYRKLYTTILLKEEVSIGDSLRFLDDEIDAITVSEMYVDGIFRNTANPGEEIKVRVHKPINDDVVVLKTTDGKLVKMIQETPSKQIPITGELKVINQKLVLEITDGNHKVVESSEMEVSPAKNSDYNERIVSNINKTGGTIYYFENIKAPDETIFLPIKEINELRRRALSKLDECRKVKKQRIINEINYTSPIVQNEKKIIVKVRNKEQYEKAVNAGIKNIIIENNKLIEQDGINHYYSSPRIFRKNDNFNATNNLGNIHSQELSGVYLNVFNSRTVNLFHRLGINLVGLSIELSYDEMKQLVDTYKNLYGIKPNLMIMGYGYYELMIMKHCLINKAEGLDKMFCNKCFEKQYYLRDNKGLRFPLLNDGQCHLSLLNNKRINLLKHINELQEIGVNSLLLDFTIESDIDDILKVYIQAFEGNYTDDLLLDDSTYGHYKIGVL
jgi:putative protease